MTRAQQIARIRKCLSLAKSANEHEAAAALAKARELMDAIGMTEAEAAVLDVEEAIAAGGRAQRPPMWEVLLAMTVSRAIGATSLTDAGIGYRRRWVGIEPTAEIASYAFTVLYRHLKADRAAYIRRQLRRCSPGRKRARADAYCEGWAASVFHKITTLMPARPEEPRVRQFLTTRYPGLAKLDVRKSTAKGAAADRDWERGVDRGEQVDLNMGVGAAARPLEIAHG